jgi:hypothetical protein
MGISDSFFALPFGKIGVYGLIRPDFVVWALGSYNLPFARFPKNKGISESILALPPGINCMGSAQCPYMHWVKIIALLLVWFVRENYRVYYLVTIPKISNSPRPGLHILNFRAYFPSTEWKKGQEMLVVEPLVEPPVQSRRN